MVRHKTRWLLVSFEAQSDLRTMISSGKRKREETRAWESKVIYRRIMDCIDSCFGVATSALGHDIQVRYFDSESNLALIRVPRHECGKVRAALTFMTTIDNEMVVATVLSVNGSARTAKLVAMEELRRRFRESSNAASATKLKKLEGRLNQIRSVY